MSKRKFFNEFISLLALTLFFAFMGVSDFILEKIIFFSIADLIVVTIAYLCKIFYIKFRNTGYKV